MSFGARELSTQELDQLGATTFVNYWLVAASCVLAYDYS